MSTVMMRQLYHFWTTALLIGVCLGSLFEEITVPDIDFESIGGEIGLFGSFDSLSFYRFLNSSSYLTDSDPSNNDSFYIRDTDKNYILKIAETNGIVSQIVALDDEAFMAIGDFTQVNGEEVYSPIIYNITSGEIESLSSLSEDSDTYLDISNGTVNSIYRDEDLIYIGGSFEFNNTYGAAIYDLRSKSLHNTKFQGFGEDSIVNSIVKIFNDGEDEGSIIFGGKFDTLGLSDLLVHNVSTNGTNDDFNTTSNYSLIMAEQMVSLKSSIFSSVNGNGDDESSIICPANDATWGVLDGEGGEWIVELPDEMKGITPSKVRIYLPDGSNSVKTFRIYSYPNTGIMNLSYIDPDTNEIMYCSSACPLLTSTDLSEIASMNKESESYDSSIFIDENGSFFSYYDSISKTKVLGYGSNFQEFAFVNTVPMYKVGVTVTEWHGSYGSMSGFELYSNTIIVYGNNSLNEPNCDDDTFINYSEVNEGNFNSVLSLSSSISGTNYLVSTDREASISLYPNISYSGNYSIIMSTPGCIADDSCNYRSIVNVSVFGIDEELLSSTLIYQNNDYDKFDYLFHGHLYGSLQDEGLTKIVISFYESIGSSETDWTVVDNVRAEIISLDNYFTNSSKNSTNTSEYKNSTLTHIKLNGLFEYSLANFSSFEEDLIYTKDGNISTFSEDNDFVGNSTLNVLSSDLTNATEIKELLLSNYSGNEYLVLRRGLNTKSDNVIVYDNTLMWLTVNSYNTSSKETELSLHDDNLPSAFEYIQLNDSVSNIDNINDSLIFLGKFRISSNNTDVIFDLSNSNESVSSANNFVLLHNNNWYGFGNDFINTNFKKFNNISIDNTEYFIFSGNNDFRVWDNSNFKWVENYHELNITEVSQLNSKEQIISGPFISVMDSYAVNQGQINSSSDIHKYNFTVEDSSYKISQSYYINDTLSIIGGMFNENSIINVGFIDESKSLRKLNGIADWPSNSLVQSLYAVEENYAFIGVNGTITLNNSQDITGLSIYDLNSDTFASFQPAELNTNQNTLEINSMAYYESASLLLIGGNFVTAGSLDCPSLCIYDLSETRWSNPLNNGSIQGTATDIKFFNSEEVLISGDFSLNGQRVNFITYNFKSGDIEADSSLNKIGENKVVQKFIFTDENTESLNGRLIAMGNNFVSGYDGSRWYDIDSSINNDSTSKLNDIKILKLESANKKNNGTLFSTEKILALAGSFELANFGFVSSALYNGSDWIPYIFSKENDKIGQVFTILIDDILNFQSSDDLKSNYMSKGKVVGISLACALGSTSLLGLLYIIPYFILFKRNNENTSNEQQRIQENEMMNAVNPEDLLHEIDLQRNN